MNYIRDCGNTKFGDHTISACDHQNTKSDAVYDLLFKSS